MPVPPDNFSKLTVPCERWRSDLARRDSDGNSLGQHTMVALEAFCAAPHSQRGACLLATVGELPEPGGLYPLYPAPLGRGGPLPR
jgi:hypothetical protein